MYHSLGNSETDNTIPYAYQNAKLGKCNCKDALI